jgi:hypothetical protein
MMRSLLSGPRQSRSRTRVLRTTCIRIPTMVTVSRLALKLRATTRSNLYIVQVHWSVHSLRMLQPVIELVCFRHGADEDWIIPVRYIASVQQIWPTDDAEPEFSSINLVWRDNVLYPLGDGRYLDSDRYSSWTIKPSDIGTIVYVDDSQDFRLIVEKIPPARLLVHLVASHTSTKFVGELIKRIASARIQKGHTFWAHPVLKASMDRKFQNLAKSFHNRHVSTKTFDHKRKRSPEPLLEKDALQVPARTKPRTDHASNAQYTQVYDSASSGAISKARNPRCPHCGRVFIKGFQDGDICEPCIKDCPSLRCRHSTS